MATLSLRTLFVFVMGALVAGCRTIPYTPGLPCGDERQALEDRKALDEMYPPSFRAVHRAVLTVRNRQFDLTGYVLVRKPGDIRLLAAAGMGSAAFEVVQHGATAMRVSRNPVRFPRRWLAGGPCHDVGAMYLFRPSDDAKLVLHDSDRMGLVVTPAPEVLQEFLFDKATRRPLGYVEAHRGHLLYEVSFSNPGLFPEWTQPVPRTITITNHQLHYRLVLSVVEIVPSSLGDEFFRSESEPCMKKPASP